MKNRREKMMFGILAVVLLLTAWTYRPRNLWNRAKGTFAPSIQVKNIQAEVLPLLLAELERDAPAYEAFERNLFGYGRDPVDPAILEKQRLEAERLRLLALEAQKRAAEEQEKPKGPPPAPVKILPPFGMKFMGYIGPLADKIAIFRDGKNFLAARQGDILKDKFIIGNIMFDSVEIGHLGYGDVETIPMEPRN